MKVKTVRNKIFLGTVEVEKICGYDVAKNFLKDNASETIELEKNKNYKIVQLTTRYEKGYSKKIILLREFKFDHETNDFIVDKEGNRINKSTVGYIIYR